MDVQTTISLLVVFGIQGVLCGDNYDVGGMIAASVIALLFLVLAILLALCICLWPGFYHKQQLLRGKKRVPRQIAWKRWWSSKVSKTTTSHGKQNLIRMYELEGAQKESRNSTLQGRTRAETWMQKLPYDTHETKSKTITLEQEEEPVIVADVLPPGTTETTHTYTHTDASQSRKLDQTQYVTSEAGPTQYTVTDGNVIRYTTSEPGRVQYTTSTIQDTSETQPIHIRMETRGYDGGVRELRTTQLRSTHVRSGENEDIIISPIIPSTSQPATYQYQTTEYYLGQTNRQPSPHGGQDEAVLQFGDGEIQKI